MYQSICWHKQGSDSVPEFPSNTNDEEKPAGVEKESDMTVCLTIKQKNYLQNSHGTATEPVSVRVYSYCAILSTHC